MKKTILFLLAAMAFAFAACDDVSTDRITVASQMGDAVGVAPMKVLIIKERGATDWTYLYNGIEGFRFEPGYEYVLDVRKEHIENPPADHPSWKYVLVKEVSKTRKTSENLPFSLNENE